MKTNSTWEFSRPLEMTSNQKVDLEAVIRRLEKDSGGSFGKEQREYLRTMYEATFGGAGSHMSGLDLTTKPNQYRGDRGQGFGPGWSLGQCRRAALDFAANLSPGYQWTEVAPGLESILRWSGRHPNGLKRSMVFSVLATHAEVVVSNPERNWEVSKLVAVRFPTPLPTEEKCSFNVPEKIGFAIGLPDDRGIPLPEDLNDADCLATHYAFALAGGWYGPNSGRRAV